MSRHSRMPLALALLVLGTLVPGSRASAQMSPENELGTSDVEAMDDTEHYEQSLAGERDEDAGDKLPLHLSDAVAQGIENNLQLQVDRFDPLIAWEGKATTWGAYDPTFSGSVGYGSDYTPNPNRLFGAARNRARTTDGALGLDALVPWLGASIGLESTGSKLDSTQFSNFQTLRPEYRSGIAVTGTLPLLKGLIWNEPWTLVKTSQTLYENSREAFRANLMDVVQNIETLYWDLVAQKQAVRVAEKSLETARSLLDQTKTQYEVGVKSKVEVVEAEAGVAAREFDLIVAVNRFRRAQDNLIDAVYGTQLTPGTHLEIVPADDPENYVAYQIDTVEAAEKAFHNRPELQQAEYEIDRQQFELKFAKNQRLPQFDIQGRYGVNGLRGKGFGASDVDPGPGVDLQPNPDTGDYSDTYHDWFTDSGGQEFSVRGVVSIPIGNVGARHTVSRRQLELRRAKTTLTQLKQQIILQVRDGARNLASAQEGIEAANRRQVAAAEQLRAERVRLEYGESTPFRVLEKESDLVSAENQKITALFTYRKSVVDLHRAQGTILQARNIVVEDAATLR